MTHVADACHVFAGGFTFGVREVMEVPQQLEVHGLGQRTAEGAGINFIVGRDDTEWPARTPKACMLFGNPRCTGFSCTTAGHDEAVHGAWSKPTIDIHQVCNYGVRQGYDLICWESVQQAMTVGRPLLDHLRDEIFVPNGYRIAHLMLNAATFGNAQHRKRYFFMAYKKDRNFNIVPPPLLERHTTCGDVLLTPELLSIEAVPSRLHKKSNYHQDCFMDKTQDEWRIIPYLPPGWDINRFAREKTELLRMLSTKYYNTWMDRTSDMPFSMHSLYRLPKDGPCPVISSSAGRFIHPTLDRPCTLRELSALMGWPPDVRLQGDNPIGQIGKGIVPAVGTWLAQQAKLYMEDHWGSEDWESSYDPNSGLWHGSDRHGYPEKTFELTRYCPEKPKNENV